MGGSVFSAAAELHSWLGIREGEEPTAEMLRRAIDYRPGEIEVVYRRLALPLFVPRSDGTSLIMMPAHFSGALHDWWLCHEWGHVRYDNPLAGYLKRHAGDSPSIRRLALKVAAKNEKAATVWTAAWYGHGLPGWLERSMLLH